MYSTYYINQVNDHYEVVDTHGKFVCSADTHQEAQSDMNELMTATKDNTYLATYLKAKAKWITRKGRRLQIPIEEPTFCKSVIAAPSSQDAVVKVYRDNYAYIITDIQLS